jgi:hypothetical protein
MPVMADSRADSRADGRDRSRSSGASLLLTALSGAVLGAAGLGWWLLSEADRRRQSRPLRPLRLSQSLRPVVPSGEIAAMPPRSAASRAQPDAGLQERVQQLNQAIDEVRRQLEQLQPLP